MRNCKRDPYVHCLWSLSKVNIDNSSYELLSKLLVSPLIATIVVLYIIPYITPFKEFRIRLV